MSNLILRLPDYWACPLMYGDYDELTDNEIEQIQKFERENVPFRLASVSDDSNFCKYHDATKYEHLACNCSTFIFID